MGHVPGVRQPPARQVRGAREENPRHRPAFLLHIWDLSYGAEDRRTVTACTSTSTGGLFCGTCALVTQRYRKGSPSLLFTCPLAPLPAPPPSNLRLFQQP